MSKIDLSELPVNPGVYLMKNGDKIIYVGKAKNLKKRVSSYFKKKHSDQKTSELVKYIESIDYILCNTELDALLLENNLIKKHKPKYNILLKDSKTYPYIVLSREKFPKIYIVRNTKYLNSKKGDIFGPYPGGAFNIIKILKRIFMIRDCNRDMNKIYDKPCLKYFMKLCPAPCVYKDVEDVYSRNVEDLKLFMRGDFKKVIQDYKKQMSNFSEAMDFETAILFREKIKDIENIAKNQISDYGKSIDEDVFTYKVDGKMLFLCVLNVREGKIVGKVSHNIKIDEFENEDLFESVFTQYYTKLMIPKNIILPKVYVESEKILKDWSEKVKERKINLYFPEIKSRRKDLLLMGELNLEKQINNFYNQKHILENGLMTLFTKLKLSKYPKRIECFDISNIQGKDAVASMSVAIDGKAVKAEYRKFRIRTKSTPDDFHMMREVLHRRYSKLPENELPDLILIDGGKGQLSSATEVLRKVKKLDKLELISIAKREEEVFKVGESESYILDKKDESLKILQRLRDEAHRFGITYHRKLRSKRVIKSELDDITGIGKKRKEILLNKFQSIDKIKEADLEELKKVVPESVALEIKKRLRGDSE